MHSQTPRTLTVLTIVCLGVGAMIGAPGGAMLFYGLALIAALGVALGGRGRLRLAGFVLAALAVVLLTINARSFRDENLRYRQRAAPAPPAAPAPAPAPQREPEPVPAPVVPPLPAPQPAPGGESSATTPPSQR